MLSTVDLIELARHRQGDVTDYRLSKLLGVPPSTVCNYQKGRSMPANPIAMRLAALCDLDPAQVVTWVNLERASTPGEREFWEMMLARLTPPKARRTASKSDILPRS